MKRFLLFVALTFVAGSFLSCSQPQPSRVPPSEWVDVDKSVQELQARWQDGDPYLDNYEELCAIADASPIKLYGKVRRLLNFNPPGVWKEDTRLLNYIVIGFELEIESLSYGTQGERLKVEWDKKRKKYEVLGHEPAQLAKGDIVRVYLRVVRERDFKAAERVAIGDMLWFAYEKLPGAEAEVFEDPALAPKAWSDHLTAKRLALRGN